MTMPITEFIFLPVMPSVQPEDELSVLGNKLLQLLRAQNKHFNNIIWGRGVDRQETICIGIELMNADSTFDIEELRPYQSAPPSTILIHGKLGDLAANPVIEITILPLEDGLTIDETDLVSSEAKAFGAAILAATAPSKYVGKMALTYESSMALKTATNTMVMIIGWREIQNHLDSSETSVFKQNLQPIQGRVSGELDIKHFHFEAL